MRNNRFDFIDTILCQGGVDISSLFTEEKRIIQIKLQFAKRVKKKLKI